MSRPLDNRIITLVRDLVAYETGGGFDLDHWFSVKAPAASDLLKQLTEEGVYVPVEVWFYISDTDNRVEDPTYGVEKIVEILDMIGDTAP